MVGFTSYVPDSVDERDYEVSIDDLKLGKPSLTSTFYIYKDKAIEPQKPFTTRLRSRPDRLLRLQCIQQRV